MATLKQSSVWDTPQVYKHHEQQNVCLTRPKYREGRRPKAVKVYTINLESRFLLVQGVPAVGVMTELVQLFALYGVVEEYRVLDEYPAEQFTEVYLIKFQKLTSARAAKRNTDERSFFGGLLHVCYAPEYETVEDTRRKLQDRRRYVTTTARRLAKEREQEQPTETTHSDCAETPAPSSAEYEDRTHPQRSREDSSSSSTSPGFALLPLPPHERVPQQHLSSKYSFKSQSVHGGSVPTEDRMGSLHSFIPSSAPDDCKQTSQWSNLPSTGNEERESTRKPKNPPSTTPRFIPRTAHLENRKRKMEVSTDLLGVADRNAPLYGPKLPELPKMDMEDESLNKTANIIRHTMAKVVSVPLEKKTTTAKARRRI